MKEEEIKFWKKVSYHIINEVEKSIYPLIGKQKAGEVVKIGADGTPTKLIDEVAEEKIIELLKKTGKSVTIVSEEIGEFKIGDNPSEVILVVDPLDGTVNALKNIPAYGISIAIVDASSNHFQELALRDVEMGFVKNLANGDLYEAFRDKGAYLNGNKLKSSIQGDLTHASIGAYIRGAEMDRISKLSHMVRRIRLLGAVAIELSYVADGTYDAFIDIRGNLRIIDIAAAKLIIEEAGGIITDEYGNELKNKLNVKERTSVIAACNLKIYNELMNVMGAF